jgi:hypothetical protein
MEGENYRFPATAGRHISLHVDASVVLALTLTNDIFGATGAGPSRRCRLGRA